MPLPQMFSSNPPCKVNLYSHILATEYGFRCGPSFLGIVHPELSQGRCVQMPDLSAEVHLIVEEESYNLR